jgi:hypothetical protein
MPRAPKKCGSSDCQLRVVGRTYCEQHTAEHQARANRRTRGYGQDHVIARRQALTELVDGQLCHLCGEPMTHAQALDLDHTPDRTGYRGLAHRRCNARAGALSRRPGGGPLPTPI